MRQGFGGKDDFRGGGERVVTQRHRRRARMVCLPVQHHFQADDADDAGDDADGDAARFQHLPLLNMQFKGGGDVVAFFQRLRLAAHAGNGRSERFAGLWVRRGKQRRVKKAADAATADAGNAPFARLLGEIVNDFQAYRTKKEPRIAVSLMLRGFKRGQRL